MQRAGARARAVLLGLLVLLFQPASRRPLLHVEPVQVRHRRARVRTAGAVRRTSGRQGPAVAVLIPAHNEAELIGATVASLQRQTRPADRVIVMADNCTDDTVAIARRGGAEVYETVGNTAKKAGALNQGFRRARDAEVVVQVDADIMFDERFLEEIVGTLLTNPTAGAVTARVGTQAFPGGGPLRWMLWMLQRLEYYYYDSMKVASRGQVWCISGIGGAYRGSVLRELSRRGKGPWNEESIVEDYSLTLDIEELGWTTGSAMGAYAWSDTMRDSQALWRQRMRWNAGTFLEWRSRARTAPLAADRRTFRRGLALVMLNPLYLALTVLLIAYGAFTVSPWSLAITAVFAADRLYRLRYVPQRRVADVLVAVLLVPEFLYRLFLDTNLLWARVKTVLFVRTARQLAW